MRYMPGPRFQFRLRTLLAVVAGIAICCAVAKLIVRASTVNRSLQMRLVGHSESDIITTYGQPDTVNDSYFSNSVWTGAPALTSQPGR